MQQLFAMGSEFYQHFTTVLVTLPSYHRSMFHEAVDYFNRAVMAQAKPLRNRPDVGTGSRRQSFDGEQHLVLLRFNALGTSGFFAYVKELADAMTELGKLAISRARNFSRTCRRANVLAVWSHWLHLILVSYHDVMDPCRGSVEFR